MNKFTLIILFSALSLVAFSQGEINNAGGRSAGMANAGLTLNDTWAVFNNPAAMSNSKTMNVGLFYQNRFLMKEIGYGALAFTTPVLGGNFGLGVTHFGFSAFQYNKFAVGYAQQLFSNFSLGMQINYFSVRQSEYYGNINALTFELGVLSKPTENFSIGAYIFNPLNLSYFEDENLKIPVALKLGISYLFSESLLLAIETGKAINGEIPVFKTGIEYTINKQFSLRTGVALLPIEYSFGLGYRKEKINFDIAYSYHEVLGSTPKLSISYEF